MPINDNGFWEGQDAEEHHINDAPLASYLVSFFKSEKASSIVDLGAGMGDYVKIFKNNNLNADCYDGNPNTPQLTNNLCKVMDLSKPHKFEKPYDWVMSLEVGEHLPKEFEDVFINNLHNNNKKGIVLSWAIEGQGGRGHINERNNDYIKEKIIKLGYTNDIEAENKMRDAATLYWFKNTLMVFRKKDTFNNSIQENFNNTNSSCWIIILAIILLLIIIMVVLVKTNKIILNF